MNIDTILHHYIGCALWSSTDENDDPMDLSYEVEDIAPETLTEMREDVTDFVNTAQSDLKLSGLSEEQIGHDFWLTRNGHGAGFWDRGLGEVGNRLSAVCKVYGSVDLCVGDDGKVYS